MDRMRVVQLLYSSSLEINAMDSNGVTMLYYLVFNNKHHYLENLLDSGADINFKYKLG